MVIDACLYNGEREIFDLRYNILKDVVDEFVVVEFGKTFSGKDKEAHPINLPKVSYHFFTQVKDLKPNLPPAFAMEYNQREMIKECLTHLDDEDVVIMGDVDEVWSRDLLERADCRKARLRPYAYYLNNRSSEDFILGPVKCRYKFIKALSLNGLRSNPHALTDEYLGWHFTNMGGREKLINKIESYGHQEFNTPEIKDQLSARIEKNEDYIGRRFTFTIDESEWPQYLKDNKDKYIHLCKKS